MPVLQSSVFSESDLDSAEPVRCALVGAGAFGSCLLSQAQLLKRRLTVPVICDTDVPGVLEAMRELGEQPPRVCENHAAAQSALSAGQTVVVSDVALLRGLPVDIVVAATGIPAVDAEVALHAITEHKHVCMVAKEAESVAGPILAKLAREAGVVCTLVDGDQPSLLVGLLDWCSLLGLEVVCAGKSGEGEYIVDLAEETVNGVLCPGLGGLWNISAGDDVAHVVAERSRLVGEALGRTVPRRTEADLGEMGVIANHTGLLPDRESLHLPLCRTLEVPRLFCPKEDGGLLDSTCLDVFVQMHLVAEPRFAGGVFAVVRGKPDKIWHMLAGKGMPSYIAPSGTTYMLLFNPQHLLGVEAPLSILSAARLGRSTGAVCPTPCTDLVAVASRDLRAGETLSLNQASHGVDALEPRLLPPQRMTLTGLEALESTAGRESTSVPYYLAAGAVMTRDVRQGERLALADVIVPRDSALFRLRVHQESLTAEDWMMETRNAVANNGMDRTVELTALSRL